MSGEPVRKRLVFYIPGFDPFPPRRYRELYRRESARQAAISGYEISQNAEGMGRYGWRVASQQGGRATQAEIRVLLWADIVQSSMKAGIAATYGQLLRTARIYISTGALRRLVRMRRGPVLAAFYPVVMLQLQLAAALLLAWASAGAFHWGAAALALPDWLGGGAAWLAGLGLGWALLAWFKRHDSRFYAYYLMHDYAFAARWRGANPPELETRMGAFGDEIAAALQGDADEVLVIGHSSGVHLGISILADLMRAGRIPADGPALGFLSLGQAVPMMSFLPEATRLRRDLHDLSRSDQLFWLDISAPGDGASFALCDPVAVSGVAPPDQKWPLILSAAFSQTLAPETYAALRWRFFRRHFQYLCAFERPGQYDYFRITAGPQTLAQRFTGQSPSPSRIATAHSKFRSMT